MPSEPILRLGVALKRGVPCWVGDSVSVTCAEIVVDCGCFAK